MKVNNQTRLKDLKNLSIEPTAMKAVKGGSSWGGGDLSTIGGGSRPQKPTGMSLNYVGGLFGG